MNKVGIIGNVPFRGLYSISLWKIGFFHGKVSISDNAYFLKLFL